MKSEDKIGIEYVEKKDGKTGKDVYWFKIVVKDGSNEFYPSFEDWYRMIRALCNCEWKKYGDRVKDPLKLPREFFNDCFNMTATWDDIEAKYQTKKYRKK
jgi:hypothetical protein